MARGSAGGSGYQILEHPIAEYIGLRIWIDADATPRDVKEPVFRSAKRLGIETVLVANQRLQTPPENPLVSAVRVDGGADVADQYIVDHASAGDLVVTQDVPLAALLVPRRVTVLDPRGEEHTAETVGERLSVRDFMEGARLAGIITGGPPPYDARAKQAFAAALDRALPGYDDGGNARLGPDFVPPVPSPMRSLFANGCLRAGRRNNHRDSGGLGVRADLEGAVHRDDPGGCGSTKPGSNGRKGPRATRPPTSRHFPTIPRTFAFSAAP